MVSSWSIPLQELEKEIVVGALLQHIKEDITQLGKKHAGFSMEGGKVRYKGRLVIPKSSRLIHKLLVELHDSAIEVHTRDFRTY